jgi:hypothetical protein
MGIHILGSGIQAVGSFNRYRLIRAGQQAAQAAQAPIALESIRRDALQLMSAPVAVAPAPVAPRPVPVAIKPAVVPAPAPVKPAPTPTPKPVQVQAAAPKPRPVAPTIDLPGVKKGLQLLLARGTRLMGYSIDGSARVDFFDGKSIALTVNASAAFGLVKKLIGLKAESKPDGTMQITAQELNNQGQPTQTYFSDSLKIVSNKPGEVVLQGPDGRPGALKVGPDGTVVLEHPAAGQIVLTVA